MNANLRQRLQLRAARFLVIIFTIPLIVLFCIKYVSIETPIYVWDFALYWETFKGYGARIASGSDWVGEAVASVWDKQYNPAAIIPLYPFYRVFGGGRTSYVTAVSLLYLLPTVVISAQLAIGRDSNNKPIIWGAAFIVALTYLPFWSPTLRGMVDIAGLIFLGLSTLIIFRSNFLRFRPVLNSVMLGLCIWTPFLFRRWYAYSIVAFYVASLLVGIAYWWRQGDRTWRPILLFISWLILSGIIVLALVASFQGGLAVRALTTSYSDLYNSYQVPFIKHVELGVARLGWYMIFMIALGAVTSLVTTNVQVSFCLLAALLTFLLFTHTQTMGVHHFLPVAFWLFPVCFMGLSTASRSLTYLPQSLRYAPVVAVSVVIFAFGVSPSLQRGGVLGTLFIPRDNSHPLHLDNYSEYKRLIADVQAGTGRNDRFEVFASSPFLSDSLLISLDPSLGSRVIYAPHIAKIYLFPFEMMRARYAIAVTPPQTNQAPGSQQNITIPGQMLLDGRGFGAAFERVGATYQLSGSVRAYLFRRSRPVTIAEMENLLDELVSAYPDWREKFRTSMEIPFAARNSVLGDVWGLVNVLDHNTLFLHPGANQPTTVTFPLSTMSSSKPTTLDVSMNKDLLLQCPNADGVELTVAIDDTTFWKGAVVPGEDAKIKLPKSGQRISISVDKNKTPSCDHVFASFEF